MLLPTTGFLVGYGEDSPMPRHRRLDASLSPQRAGFIPRPVYVGFFSEQSGTGTGIFESTSIFPCHCHSTGDP